MANAGKRKNKKKKRSLIPLMILLLLALLTAGGAYAGIRLRGDRMAEEAAKAEEIRKEEERQKAEEEAARKAEEEAREAAARAEEEEARRQAEMEETAKLLEEQSRQGKIENAKVIIGAAEAAQPEVNAYSRELFESKIITAEHTSVSGARLICIDPGHQREQIREMEPNAPGSEVMKQGATSGTHGDASGKDEFEVVLEVSLRLRDILEARGYRVVMTRESHDVSISNVQRAKFATEAGADLFIRVHCNGVDDESVSGVLCYMPSEANPHLSADVIAESRRLSTLLRDSQCAVTLQTARDNLEGDDMTGINWATMPVSIIEIGFMSNPEEDLMMASPEGQDQIAIGIADGVDAYYAS